MSSEEEKKKPMSDLISYLKEDIPIEDIRDYASPQRINSIDFVKGFAIVFIIIAHTSMVWFDSDWIYIHGMVYAALDILGPSLFIFLSALSVIFSIRRKQGRLPDKVIRNRIFSRGLTIIVIGMLFNLIGLSAVRPDIAFPFNLWGWNILMFIGFSQIFTYYAVKLRKWPRAIIGIIIILISPFFREFLYLEKDSNPLIWLSHFIVTSPTPEITLFPWLAVCFISSIFGEYLYDAMMMGTEEAYFRLFRLFLIWGLIFLISGLILGWQLQTPETMVESEYPHLRLYTIMNKQNYYHFRGMREFLIRGTIGNMLYNQGAALLIIAICFYLIDIKKHDNKFTSMIQYYGKISLSLFLVEYVFITLFIGQFNIVVFPFVCLAYIGFLGFLLYIWNEYFNGVGSPEWIMIQIGRIGQKTGESVKKEAKKIEGYVVKEVSAAKEKIKETFKKKKEIKE